MGIERHVWLAPEGAVNPRRVAQRIGRAAVLAMAIGATITASANAGEPWEKALEDGLGHLASQDPRGAIKPLKKAIKQRGAPCGPCQLALARARYLTGSYSAARTAATEAVSLAEDDQQRLRALNLLGLAEFESGAAGEAGLERAEAAFRQVLSLADSNAVRYSLGEVLLRLSRDQEGVAMLTAYLEAEPNGTHAERARLLVENPLRARKNLVPTFEAMTLAGAQVSSDGLQGKVVLIDFWATWCKPCVAAVPALKQLAKRMEDAPLVVLSISVDRSKEVVHAFLDQHGITWPQVWDGTRNLASRVFSVTGYPTYVLLDHRGEVIYRVTGGGSGIDAEIARRVSAAIRKAKKDQAAPG